MNAPWYIRLAAWIFDGPGLRWRRPRTSLPVDEILESYTARRAREARAWRYEVCGETLEAPEDPVLCGPCWAAFDAPSRPDPDPLLNNPCETPGSLRVRALADGELSPSPSASSNNQQREG